MMTAAVCMLASCGMNQAQAIARVKQLAQDTAHAIAPGVPATAGVPTISGRADPLVESCPGEFGADKVEVSDELRLPVLPAQRSQQILFAARAYFEKSGYKVTGFSSTGVAPGVNAETPDGFYLEYGLSTDGTSYVGAASSCVSRN